MSESETPKSRFETTSFPGPPVVRTPPRLGPSYMSCFHPPSMLRGPADLKAPPPPVLLPPRPPAPPPPRPPRPPPRLAPLFFLMMSSRLISILSVILMCCELVVVLDPEDLKIRSSG